MKAQLLFYPVTEQLFVFNKEAKLIKETEGRFTCTDCGYVYSSMLGDDEIPETCNKCKKGVDFLDSNDYYINISAKGDRYDNDKRNERL